MTAEIIASAVFRILQENIRSVTEANADRAFFRLDGFDDDVYRALCDHFKSHPWVGGIPAIVRTTKPLGPAYNDFALEPGRTATSYRNSVPAGQALVLIFNQITSDRQSLSNLFVINESLVSKKHLDSLLDVAFRGTPLQSDELDRLRVFLSGMYSIREPQLRSLVSFLQRVGNSIQYGESLNAAIGRSLPAIQLFRAAKVTHQLGARKSPVALMKKINNAANKTLLAIEGNELDKLLTKLKTLPLEDSTEMTASEKRQALESYIRGVDTKTALEIDWDEVELLVSGRARPHPKPFKEQLKELGIEIQTVLDQKDMIHILDEDCIKTLDQLLDGQAPDPDAGEFFIESVGKSLGAKLARRTTDLLGVGKPDETEDFPLGVTAAALGLLGKFETFPSGAQVHVKLLDPPEGNVSWGVFKLLYGSIDALMPAIKWDFPSTWGWGDFPEDGAEERELYKLSFRVSVQGPEGEENSTTLIWQLRYGSPLHDLIQSIKWFSQKTKRGRVQLPLFSVAGVHRVPSPAALSETLGPWWEMSEQNVLGEWISGPRRLRGIHQSVTEALADKIEALEGVFAEFVNGAMTSGVLPVIPPFLEAYEDLLESIRHLAKTGQEVRLATDLINRAWTICDDRGNWVVVPPLHPLKLLWFLNRVRRLDDLLRRLQIAGQEPAVVDAAQLEREMESRFSSAYFPAVISYGQSSPVIFLPSEEENGSELYLPAARSRGYSGSGVTPEAGDRAALRVAAMHVVRSLEAYLEAHPFSGAGMEVLLANVESPELPIELLKQLGSRIKLSLTVHSPVNASAVFAGLNEWVNQNEWLQQPPDGSYFSPVTMSVREGNLIEVVQDVRYDVVVLVDALSESGQQVSYRLGAEVQDEPIEDFLPSYRPLIDPFTEGAGRREVSLTPSRLPNLVLSFYDLQAANRSPDEDILASARHAQFFRVLELANWPQTLKTIHEQAVWFVCYDINADRFLLETAAEKGQLHIIQYVLGLGPKKLHNLTVSSSYHAREEVVRRLNERLNNLLPHLNSDFLGGLSRSLVELVQKLSGSVVLRAAGPGTVLNELLGIAMTKYRVEEQLLAAWPDALITWVYLDDHRDWFGRSGKRPDLLAVAARISENNELELRFCVAEAKCVSSAAIESEYGDAVKQARRGTSVLRRAFLPGSPFVDSEHWYQELYQAIVSNLEFKPEDRQLVEKLTDILSGRYNFSMLGQAWVFGYDVIESNSSAVAIDEEDESVYGCRADRRAVRSTLNSLLAQTHGDIPELPLEDPATPANVPEPQTVKPDIKERPAESHVPLGRAFAFEPPNGGSAQVESPGTDDLMEAGQDSFDDIAHQSTGESDASLALLKDYDSRGNEDAAMKYANDCMDKTVWFLKRLDQRVGAAGVLIGPRVIRLKLTLAIDKTSNFKNVAAKKTDLKLQLKLESEPHIEVGNDGTIWIDIPRPQPATVGLKPLLRDLGAPGLPPNTRFPLGLAMDGRPYLADLRKVPHWLVGGTSGSGKSIFLRSVLLSLMLTNTPDSLRFVIIDPKGDLVAFRDSCFTDAYVSRSHLAEQAVAALRRVKNQLDQRLELMVNSHRVNEIDDFHRIEGKVKLPRVVVLIEEYGDLISNDQHSKEIEGLVEQIAAIGRAPGYHLFVCTQNPVVKTVSTDIKANCSGRVALWVKMAVNSQVILDEPGAEDLLKNGDMLFKSDGPTVRIQAPYVDNLAELQPTLEALARKYGTNEGGCPRGNQPS